MTRAWLTRAAVPTGVWEPRSSLSSSFGSGLALCSSDRLSWVILGTVCEERRHDSCPFTEEELGQGQERVTHLGWRGLELAF